MNLKRLLPLIFCVCFLFSACRFDKDDGIIRYDMQAEPYNLDPQTVLDDAGKTVLRHVMEGLFVTENGELKLGCVDSYSVSSDGLQYTLMLKKDLVWSNGAPLTADDFVFAFYRLFSPETGAMNLSKFYCIKNAQRIINKELAVEHLGVQAVENDQLVFHLEYRSSDFLQALSGIEVLPCNREFFEESRGKYGSNRKNLLYNGKFSISDWVEGKYIALRPNKSYHNQNAVFSAGINLYCNPNNDAQRRFLEGTTDAVMLTLEHAQNADTKKIHINETSSTTWVMGFNQTVQPFQSESMRKALLLPLAGINLSIKNSVEFSPAESLIPPALTLQMGKYTLDGTLESAKQFFDVGLKDTGLKSFPGKIEIIAPERQDFKLFLTYVQKAWMDTFGIAVNFETLDDAAYQKALSSGNFDIAIFAVTAQTDSLTDILSTFSSDSARNILSWKNNNYDSALINASKAVDSGEQFRYWQDACSLLIDEAVVFPVFYQKQFIATQVHLRDADISPFGLQVNFNNAYKET